MPPAWKDYQEEVATFFRSLGLDAATDVTVSGARTTHNIDVLVKSHHVGFEITWLVECKHWKTRVSKLHVLALREIVADVGADRGLILSETGFQSGAVEAANLTNVRVTALAEISDSTKDEVYSMRLRELFERLELISERYWRIPKRQRIEHGLRQSVSQIGYSGAHVINLSKELLSEAFRGEYPIERRSLEPLIEMKLADKYGSPEEVYSTVESLVCDLEKRLDTFTESISDSNK